MKLRKNLYVVTGGFYGQLGNAYMIKHDHGCVLFDCGNPNAFETIKQNLEYWDVHVKDVTHVFMTHGHDDHAGTASLFQKEGAKIVVGASDAPMLAHGNLGKDTPFLNHNFPKCSADILIDEDMQMVLGNLEINIYTMPGHTDGTLVYYVKYDDECYLFTGDMFNTDGEKGDKAHMWWKGDLSYDAKKLGESFKKLWTLHLDPTVIVGGHGNPRIGKGTKDIIMIAYKEYLLTCR